MTQEEAVPESLKNILLVMADGGYLMPPSGDDKGSEVWTETRKRVDRFLPDLFADIFPKVNPSPATTAAAHRSEEPSNRPAEPLKETTEDPATSINSCRNDRKGSCSPAVPPEQALT